jgi:hypothetical protein
MGRRCRGRNLKGVAMQLLLVLSFVAADSTESVKGRGKFMRGFSAQLRFSPITFVVKALKFTLS